MTLKRLENHRGVALYVDPDDVRGLSESVVDGCTAIAVRAGDKLTARGTPDEVHEVIFGASPTRDREDFYLSGKAVVAALTHEYRMTLGDMESGSTGHCIRVAILSAAGTMGLTLDERLLNTPLDGSAP